MNRIITGLPVQRAVLGGVVALAMLVGIACGSEDPAIGSGSGAQPVATATAEAPDEGAQVASPEASPEVSDLNTHGRGNSRAQGRPAIKPGRPAEPGRPTFTEGDVRAYVLANLPSRPDPDGDAPAVKYVEFLPVEEVEVRINHPVSVPRGTLLCLVAISGDWLPPGGIEVTEPAPENWVIYQIFDAATGNLIANTGGVDTR